MFLALLVALQLLSNDVVGPHYASSPVPHSVLIELRLPRERSGRILFGLSVDGKNSNNWIAVRENLGWLFGEDALSKLCTGVQRIATPAESANDGGP